ncbi:MAG TPA: hypothetical protein VLM38_20300 [Blastocatellia bacterium]|nr:hypothetical protein [Blastocatellia bacterium]
MNSKNPDEEHLRLLSIFHYVVGGITALCACFPLIHLVVGLTMIFAPERLSGSEHTPGPERMFGLFFVVLASAFIILGWALAAANVYVGRCLTRREKHTFCLVVAAVNCINTPIGTVLGVFTIIVLMRPSVKAMFETNRACASAEPAS